MKGLALAAILLAGCVAARGGDSNVEELERKSRDIAARAKRCISAAIEHSSQATAPNGSRSPDGSQTRIGKKQRDREIAKCKATESRESEELSSRQQREYLLQAEQERSSATLMMILTTSKPH